MYAPIRFARPAPAGPVGLAAGAESADSPSKTTLLWAVLALALGLVIGYNVGAPRW